MIKIRKAKQKDKNKIVKILKDADEYYPHQKIKDFFVAEEKNEILGTVQIKDYKDFLFLSSLCVKRDKMRKGIGSLLLKKFIMNNKKDVYLYTVIPNFFKKFGFKKTENFSFLPSKKYLRCKECFPKKCVTMVKKQNDASLSRI
ncbi:MAG: GNAT family N-acetyltransferase [Candidatus Nanoarchaeia archaeon]